MARNKRPAKRATHSALLDLEPSDLIPEGPSWQKRKSAETRTAILEATIHCLEKFGYAQTTTQLVAETANISRGAMLHHYQTKLDLISSVLDFAFYKRMETYLSKMKALSEYERVDEHVGIEVMWENLQTREFAAYLELATAARTDPELQEIFLPKARRYDRVLQKEAIRLFPEWSNKPKQFAFVLDYCTAAMEGLLLNRDIWESKARRRMVRDFISKTTLLLRSGDLDLPVPAPKRREA